MNTKSKLKAISIGIAAIMMVSLLAAVTTVSATDITNCEIGDDNKVYFTIYSDAKAGGYMCLNIDGVYQERKKFSLNAGETATLSFRDYRWNGVDVVEVCVDCVDSNCCTPPGPTPPTPPPPPPEPDLVVIEKWETLNVDGQVIVHFIIENIGDADAGESYATLYIDNMVVEIQNVLVPVLGPDGRFTSAFAAEPCTPGTTITVKVCADDTHVVEESDENNNCETNDFTCPIPGKPDLVVEDKWEECADGQMIVHFIIENIGDAEAGESYATLYIDDMLVEEQNVWVPVLGKNGRFTSEFEPEDCTPGTTIKVTVCADDTHVVNESNEDNNCKQNDFTCPEVDMPDLVVNDTYETLNEDGQVIVHFVVKNKGDAEAGESEAALYINSVRVQTQNVPVSAVGPSGTFASEFEPEPCPSGMTINYTVCADDTKVVDESNETNNCMTNDFTCPTPGKPDLVVSDMREESVKANGHVIVHFEIHNNGTADAGASFATKYLFIDDVLVEKHNAWVPALGPSGRFNGAFEPEECPLHKNITIIVCADDTHVVDESNETNNCMTNNFTCPSQGPDLVIEKTVEMWNYRCYQCRYMVNYKVTNIGNEIADWCCGDVEVGLLVDGMFVNDRSIPDLGPGASYEGTFGWYYCPCGEPFDVTVCADYYKVVDESNETNNCETNHEYCGVGDIEVDKKVWYRGDWQDTYWYAEHGDIVEFQGRVTNDGCCCELTDITVTDVLSRSLEYVDATGNPSVDYDPIDKTTTLTWTKSLLEQCDDEYYYITARVIGCGENNRWDRNTMTANATTCTDEVVEDSDYASVYAPPVARMEVTKTVWDGTDWVNDIWVSSGTPVAFRITVHNDGTCHDLYNIEVSDSLSRSLSYNGYWCPWQSPWCQVPIVTGPNIFTGITTVNWNLVTPDPLEPCETIEFIVYAIAHGPVGWNDRNRVQVTAWSEERGTPYGKVVFDWGDAWVHII